MHPTPVHCAMLWLLAVLVSASLTQVVILAARKFNLIDKPKADRWNQTPTALYGGVAIVVTFLLVSMCVLARFMPARSYEMIGLFVGGFLLFALGVRDDALPLNPLVKLLGQVMAVTPFLIGMALAHTTPLYIFAMPAVLLWMVALTNAFNLLDNMNGLSAGTAATVSGVLSLYAFQHGDILTGLFSALLAARAWAFSTSTADSRRLRRSSWRLRQHVSRLHAGGLDDSGRVPSPVVSSGVFDDPVPADVPAHLRHTARDRPA